MSPRRARAAPEAPLPEYVLDGRRTTSPGAFYAELGRAVLGTAEWGAAPGAEGEAMRELLGGGFGAAPARFRLVWRHADLARAALGHDAAARELLGRLRDCPPNVLIKTAWALRAALRGAGPTAFDALVAAVREHPNVELVLEGVGTTPAAPASVTSPVEDATSCESGRPRAG